MEGSASASSANARSASPMQIENHTTETSALPTSSTTAARAATPQEVGLDRKPSTSASKAGKIKSRKSSKAHTNPAGSLPPNGVKGSDADVEGEPLYRLARVQKIVRMNDTATISKEAVVVMALAAEEITRRLTRAGCDVAGEAQRQELKVSDLATAVLASSSLSFLSEMIPQTIPFSTAMSRRESKDSTSLPPDATQAMLSSIQERLKPGKQSHSPSSQKQSPPAQNAVGTTTSGGAPIRPYSMREAQAVANTRRNSNGVSGNGRAGSSTSPTVPTGPMGQMISPHAIPFPPGFDYRSLPPHAHPIPFPPPDSEAYRNGMRWTPMQPGTGEANSNGAWPEGAIPLPPGMWSDINGQIIMAAPVHGQPVPMPHPYMYPGSPHAPNFSAPGPGSSKAAAGPKAKRTASKANANRQTEQPAEKTGAAETPSTSTIAAGDGAKPKEGIIENASGPVAGAASPSSKDATTTVEPVRARESAATKTNGRTTASSTRKKRTSTRGRKKDLEEEDDDMDTIA